MSYLKIWYLNVSLWLAADGYWWLAIENLHPCCLNPQIHRQEWWGHALGAFRKGLGRIVICCVLWKAVEIRGLDHVITPIIWYYMCGNQLWVKCEIRRGERRHGPKIGSRYKEYTWLGDQNGYTTRNVPKAKKLRKLYVGGWKDDKRHGLRLKFRMKTELPEGGSSWADPGTFSRHFTAQVAELASSAMVSSSRATGLRLDMEVTNMAVSPQKMRKRD